MGLALGPWACALGAAANQEAAALLTIRSGFTNRATVLPDWTSRTDSPCDWTGVKCIEGNVVRLHLDGMGLEGTITPEGWMQLQSLQRIYLQDNRLAGSLSEDWLLPDTLASIDVSNNSLGGTLPPRLRFPENLGTLYLFQNAFQGTIPAWTLPVNLTEVVLYQNQLTGPYPSGLVLPEGLETLILAVNNLTGPLDANWVFPSSLQVLDLSNNNFSGTIPSNWTLLPDSVQYLYLHSNPRLTGPIPPDWVLPEALVELQLHACDFTGRLPTDLKLPSGLQVLHLYGNALTGTIPAHWVLPDSITTLSLDSNKLSGSIPAGWKLSSDLQDLKVSYNLLTGTIPLNLSLPSKLKTLSLAVNQLSGTLSKDWKLPETLQELYLYDNQIEGTLDPAWKLPVALKQLDISQNSFSGLLPAWNLPNLEQAVFSFCNFTGPLPSYPASSGASVIVMPQFGPGFCGDVPRSPPYHFYDPSNKTSYAMLNNDSFDSCPQETPPRYTYPPIGSPPPPSPLPPPLLPPSPPPPATSLSPFPSPVPSPEIPGSSGGKGSSAVGIAVGVAVGVAALVGGALGIWWWKRCTRPRRDVKRHPHRVEMGGGSEGSSGWRYSSGKDEVIFEPLHAQLEAGAVKPRGVQAQPMGDNTDSAFDPQQDPILAAAVAARVQDGSSEASSQHAENRKRLDKSGLRNWVVEFDTLELKQQIGEGSYGRVFLAKWQRTPVAVKILVNTALDVYNDKAVKRALTLSNPVLENLQKEAVLMCKLRHPNIVTFLGVCPLPPCVVTEYCERGSLADVLEKAKQSPSLAAKVGWLRRLSMMLDTAKGMLHLHSHSPPIIHRDLKSHNLLVDSHWRCKVSDFNLSRILEDRVGLSGGGKLSQQGATNPRWLAPEVLEGQPASLKSDVYSFGIVLWELLTWDVPFADYSHFQLIKHVAARGRPALPRRQDLPGSDAGELRGLDGYVSLMQLCWAHAPEERPSFQEAADALGDILSQAKASGAS